MTSREFFLKNPHHVSARETFPNFLKKAVFVREKGLADFIKHLYTTYLYTAIEFSSLSSRRACARKLFHFSRRFTRSSQRPRSLERARFAYGARTVTQSNYLIIIAND